MLIHYSVKRINEIVSHVKIESRDTISCERFLSDYNFILQIQFVNYRPKSVYGRIAQDLEFFPSIFFGDELGKLVAHTYDQ
jgi:hypothetical protein